ncbi:hypothetical protein Tco_1459022 [Tanacetum coccineum]
MDAQFARSISLSPCEKLWLPSPIGGVSHESLEIQEPLPSGPGAYDQSLEVLLTQHAASESESGVPGAVSDRSEAPDESPGSILSNVPKAIGKYRASYSSILTVSCKAYKSCVSLLMGAQPSFELSGLYSPTVNRCYLWNCLCRIYPSLAQWNSLRFIYGAYSGDILHNLLRGGCLDSGISSLRSTGAGMDRDGGSGGGGNAVVTASMRT